MENEWEIEKEVIQRHEIVTEPHIRVVSGRNGELTLYITRPAYIALGEPKHVQMMFSSSRGLYRLRLTPSDRTSTSRPVRSGTKSRYEMGGSAGLVKRRGFPKGYYMMDEDKIFTWRFS